MAEYQMRVVRQAFSGKLGGTIDAGGKHDRVLFEDEEGTTLGKTRLSRGHDTVSMKTLGFIANELGIRLNELRGAIDCSVSRQQFYDGLRNSTSP